MNKKYFLKFTLVLVALIPFYSCHANILDAIRLSKKITQSEFISKDFDSLTVPFDLVNGSIVVSVNIQSKEHIIPAKFILDSGAPTVISDNLARENQFPEEEVSEFSDVISTPDGLKSTPEHLAKNLIFEIGSYKVKKENTLVKHLGNNYNMSCNDIDGLLGSDFLNHVTILIDFQKRIIKFVKPEGFHPQDYGFNAFWKFGSYSLFQKTPYLTVSINNQEEAAIVDLGYNGTVLMQFRNPNHKDAKQFLKNPDKQTVETFGSMATINGSIATIRNQYLISNGRLTQNKLALNSNQISFLTNTKLKEDKVNIGVGFLKNYLVAIDWKSKKLYLKEQNPLSHQSLTPKFIVSYFPIDKKFCVSAISTDSKWYQKGIRAGDTVLNINETDLAKLTINNNVCSIRDLLDKVSETTNTITVIKKGAIKQFALKEENKNEP